MNLHKTKISPSKIIDGTNIFQKNLINENEIIFGKRPFLIVKNDVFQKFQTKFFKDFEEKNIIFSVGECCASEVLRLENLVREKASSVVGIGGGKILDTAKFVAHNLKIPSIMIPTSAATGASSSALSAMYTDDGASIDYRDVILEKCADLLILDYDLILDSPSRFLIAGICDSLAKYYESFAFTRGDSKDIFVNCALDLSKKIKLELFRISEAALSDFQTKNLTENLKNLIKINVILAPMVGGMGGEGCRSCISHGVHNSLTQIPRMRKFLHGELVAFGNLAQLTLDDRKEAKAEKTELLEFHQKIGMMRDFAFFDTKLNDDEFEFFLEHLCSENNTLVNMPRQIKKDEIIDCFKKLKMI